MDKESNADTVLSKQIRKMRLEILGDAESTIKDKVFETKLEDAEVIALNTLYPYDKTISKLPDDVRLQNWKVRCAIELYRKMGTTNVQSYSENGLSVTFMSGLISSSLMKELVSKAGVPK